MSPRNGRFSRASGSSGGRFRMPNAEYFASPSAVMSLNRPWLLGAPGCVGGSNVSSGSMVSRLQEERVLSWCRGIPTCFRSSAMHSSMDPNARSMVTERGA